MRLAAVRPALLAAVVLACAPPGPRAAEPAAKDSVADEVRHVAESVERIRGARLSPVPEAIRSTEAERRGIAAGRVASAIDAARLAARGRAWSDVGFGDEGSPRLLYDVLACDLDGIAYDPSSRRFLVDTGRLTDADFEPREEEDATSSLLLATGVRPDEPVVAHVLVHALDRGRRGADYLAASTDATLASAAWLEGEANLVALLYLFEGLGIEGRVVEKRLDPGSVLGGSLLPSRLDRMAGPVGSLLDFVYRDGFERAAEAYGSGGFKSVDRAAAARSSTRDVLHPKAAPRPAQAPAAPSPLPGFVVADADSVGEMGIIAVVSALTGKDNLGLMAGDGWVSDSLIRFEPVSGTPDAGYTEWVSRFATPADAEELEYGLVRSLESRFPAGEAWDRQPTEVRLLTASRVFTVARRDAVVTFRVVPAALAPRFVPTPAPKQPAKAKTKSKLK